MNLKPVRRVLDALGARYALIGGRALAARGYPRFTVDIDLLTADSRVLERNTWTSLERSGASLTLLRGDHDDPLAGVAHILLADGTDVDIVLAKWKWEAAVIDRAESMNLGLGDPILVPCTSDLILLKLVAGGSLDLRDAAALLELGDRDTIVAEVHARIGEVHPDVREAWNELLRQTN